VTNPTDQWQRSTLWPLAFGLIERMSSASWAAPAIGYVIKSEAAVRSGLDRGVAFCLHASRLPTLGELRRLSEEVAALRYDVQMLARRKGGQ
jgi:hypothetical protein